MPKRRSRGDSANENNLRTTSDVEHGCPGFVTALVLRCGQGDESALLALMELLYRPVRARLTTAALTDAETDELVGLAFIQIWRSAQSYDPSAQVGVVAWLLGEAESAPGRIPSVLAAS